MKEPQTATITARVSPSVKRQFLAASRKEKDKNASDVLRQLIQLYLSNHSEKETAK